MMSATKVLVRRALSAWFLCVCLGLTSTNAQTGASNTTCSLMSCEYTYQLSNSTFSCPNAGCSAIPTDIPEEVVITNLRGNRIESVGDTLQYYRDLENLDLSSNAINAIVDRAFPPNLVSLNLSNNLITMGVLAGAAFDDINKLEYLNLANNRIENLTIANIFWFKMSMLKRLDMSGNQIVAMVHNAITDLRLLESIDLSRNLLKDLEAEDFMGLGHLHHLNLSANRLEEIPDRFFHGLDAIKTLDLSDNFIAELSNLSLAEGDALETLHLQRNKLRRIPSVMSTYLTRLQFLYLDGNPLETIEAKAFPSSLKGISIRRSDTLKEIADIFHTESSQLTTVAISDNAKLNAIHVSAFGGPDAPVKDLDLSYNALTTLPESLVNWGNLTSADLSGNYWDCDCKMAWVQGLPVSSPVLQTIVCYSPLHLRGLKPSSLDASEFSCSVVSRYRRQAAVVLAIVFTAIVFTSLTLVVRRYRHRICPSMYPAGKYETLYSSAEAAADDDLSLPVTIKKKTGDTCSEEPVAV